MNPSRLTWIDTLRVGALGLRSRPTRIALSAAGIAIGVAAMLSVVGITTSSRASLDRMLAELGTNMLTVTPGTNVFGAAAVLPEPAVSEIGRIAAVESVTSVSRLAVSVYRNDHIPAGRTSSIAVFAARLDLLGTLRARVAAGRFLDGASSRLPTVVLGASAAQRLDIHQPGLRVWLGGTWFGVVGILEPVPLAQEIDASVLVGEPAARQLLGFDGHPGTIYTRIDAPEVEQVRRVLPATANPAHPEEVRVSRPSDALSAKRATDRTLTAMLAGLGAVALLIGGLGVANTMVVSVLERRAEIGLRRALGASRAHIRRQFLTEAMVLALLGGVAGTIAGLMATTAYAVWHGWPSVLPWWAVLGGPGLTMLIGPVAGLVPARQAARLDPVRALA
jgi:putative ABC transport system permease protein